jgi:MoaA/NifB/PqqE/SkfB family radical SAM enzyme
MWMKVAMNISINPWYYCNFRCDFCYLTTEQLGDKKLLSIDQLHNRLTEISVHEPIGHVDLYGGEPMLLPDSYISELKSCLSIHGVKEVNVNTNLSGINSAMLDPFFQLSVSYDFEAREQHERVWRNMLLLDREFSVLMLAGPKLITLNTDSMIQQFNLLNNLTSVEIKPYSTNQSNQHGVSFKDFEEFVKQWITSPIKKEFEFINEYLLEDVLSKTRNSFSDDHIYITPNGNFAVLEFDLNDNEFFLEYDNFDQYLDWCKKEKQRTADNKFCSKCEYFGNCLSEHLREVKNLDNSCNGFKGLIDWYGNRLSK